MMIKKIRHILIVKYTSIIACILFLGFFASYIAYSRIGINLVYDSLSDYLTEEVWEAEEFFNKKDFTVEIHKINSNIKSLYNFSYWIIDKKIIRAERIENDEIAKRLEQRILSKDYDNGKIYHENIKYNGNKWYFIVIKQKISSKIIKNGEVFVVANYTPIRKNAKDYVIVALFAILTMIILAYIIGNIFTSRSMEYIEISYKKQKQFVSDAAHELRTPLAILYSYVELLELEHKLHHQELVINIKDEILQMNEMVDKLLTIAKYDNSKTVMQKEFFSLNKVISKIIKSMEHLVPIDTFCFIKPHKDIKIYADKIMFCQLVRILLDNAIKYTKKIKKIKIEIVKENKVVKIIVNDNGIGIKKEDLPYIFDKFWRADKSRNKNGLGLGLSLASSIVSMHNGTISVNSIIDKGTTFEITLPLK